MVKEKWRRNHLRCVASFISTLVKNNYYLADVKITQRSETQMLQVDGTGRDINVTNRKTLPNAYLLCERRHQVYEVLLTNHNKHLCLSGFKDPRDIILTSGVFEGAESPPPSIEVERGQFYYMIYDVKSTLSYRTTLCHKQQQQHQWSNVRRQHRFMFQMSLYLYLCLVKYCIIIHLLDKCLL